ncbi:MAG: hypothetical protein J7497_15495, partial [Chitinophagaceae bacterium]|nr:hypothetical protein [Chitinophagaceae bacterium]
MRALHLGILLCLYVNCFGQKETYHWFPSLNHLKIDKNGITNLWNSFMPVNLNSLYGSTSFSDQSGRYLFATDGDLVINRDNEIIASGLKGTNIVLSAAVPG